MKKSDELEEVETFLGRTFKANVALRVQRILDLLYPPIYDEKHNLLGIGEAQITPNRAMEMLNARDE